MRFLQADFLDLAADPTALVCADGQGGPFAYAVAHGIFTWVAPAVQDALLEVTTQVLQPGGLFYCSYNTLPGWLSRTPFQSIALLELERHGFADPASAFQRAIATVKGLLGTPEQPSMLALALPSLEAEIDLIAANPQLAYLCGEYGSSAWQPLAVGQMHPRCHARQLRYLGSATLPELFDQFMIEPQRTVVCAEANPLIREALFDLAINQSFRRDLFVKGALPLPAPLRQEALAALRLQPLVSAAIPECDYVFANSFGDFHADPGLCRAVEARLAMGACSVGQLGLELAMEPDDLLPGLAILLDAVRITLEPGPGPLHPCGGPHQRRPDLPLPAGVPLSGDDRAGRGGGGLAPVPSARPAGQWGQAQRWRRGDRGSASAAAEAGGGLPALPPRETAPAAGPRGARRLIRRLHQQRRRRLRGRSPTIAPSPSRSG